MNHVLDNELKVPAKLKAWATNVTHPPYLAGAHFDHTTLNDTDTHEYAWKEMPFMNAMEEDTEKASEWIPVSAHRRSKSLPNPSPTSDDFLPAGRSDAPGINPPGALL